MATQERKSGTVRASDGVRASHAELGIPRQRAAEMKKLADAGEDAIRSEVKRAN